MPRPSVCSRCYSSASSSSSPNSSAKSSSSSTIEGANDLGEGWPHSVGDVGVNCKLSRLLLAAVASGAAMLLAFPPYDIWWLAPVAVALLAAGG